MPEYIDCMLPVSHDNDGIAIAIYIYLFIYIYLLSRLIIIGLLDMCILRIWVSDTMYNRLPNNLYFSLMFGFFRIGFFWFIWVF